MWRVILSEDGPHRCPSESKDPDVIRFSGVPPSTIQYVALVGSVSWVLLPFWSGVNVQSPGCSLSVVCCCCGSSMGGSCQGSGCLLSHTPTTWISSLGDRQLRL